MAVENPATWFQFVSHAAGSINWWAAFLTVIITLASGAILWLAFQYLLRHPYRAIIIVHRGRGLGIRIMIGRKTGGGTEEKLQLLRGKAIPFPSADSIFPTGGFTGLIRPFTVLLEQDVNRDLNPVKYDIGQRKLDPEETTSRLLFAHSVRERQAFWDRKRPWLEQYLPQLASLLFLTLAFVFGIVLVGHVKDVAGALNHASDTLASALSATLAQKPG